MILHFVRCTVDLWDVISMFFGYIIGLCQSPLDPRYEILYEALVISGQMPSALPPSHTLSPLVMFTAAESFGMSHVNAMKTCLSVYIKHFIQSRCKWSLSCTIMVNTTWSSYPSGFFSFFPAFSLSITATLRGTVACVVSAGLEGRRVGRRGRQEDDCRVSVGAVSEAWGEQCRCVLQRSPVRMHLWSGRDLAGHIQFDVNQPPLKEQQT